MDNLVLLAFSLVLGIVLRAGGRMPENTPVTLMAGVGIPLSFLTLPLWHAVLVAGT